jgi:ribosomal protein S18 acetylase RimI-like enzyme
MAGLKDNISRSLENNHLIKDDIYEIEINGYDPWDLIITFHWKDLGRFRFSPFEISDFWELKDWWKNTLNKKSKAYFPLFPNGNKLERAISNHYKNHNTFRDAVFNLWHIKEGSINSDFDNEIIAHAFIEHFNKRPDIALGISDKYQSKGFGKFILLTFIYIAKYSGKEKIYLSVDKDNIVGFELYKKIGFRYIDQKEISIPITGYNSIINNMELDLDDFL